MNNIICVRTTGAVECIPAENNVLSQAKRLLSGAYIEVAGTSIPGLMMLIDEDGKRKGLPVNKRATALYPNRYDCICGDAVFVNVDGKAFCALKDGGYVETVLGMVV